MPAVAGLSPEELLHLAIADSRNGRHDQAIIKLKQCIAENPAWAAAFHLLGAEHAEIGMFQQAVQELERAVALEPAAVPARFQLGLVHAVNNAQQQARQAWAPLAELDRDGPWNLFRQALEALMDGNAADALQHVERGLALKAPNPALQADMSRLRDRIRNTIESQGDNAQKTPVETLLNRAYGGSDDDGAR